MSTPKAYTPACPLSLIAVHLGKMSLNDVNSGVSSNRVLYVDHPAVRSGKIEARSYQKEIAEKASLRNTLVVLPTALGKTVIAALVVADLLYKFPKMRILMMAPTRPLVLQHLDSFCRLLKVSRENLEVLMGTIPGDERRRIWQGEAKMFFATPQTVRNDLQEGRVQLSDFSLLIFDEGHRARKNYAYNAIARKYMEEGAWPIILALTASPGSSRDRIEEVCSNLYIEQIEYRSEENIDVLPYVHPVEVEWKKVELPEAYKELSEIIEIILQENLKWLNEHRFLTTPIRYTSRRTLLDLGDALRGRLRELAEDQRGPIYTALVRQATSLTLFHAKELLETQGISTLTSFLDKVSRNAEEKSSYRRLKRDPRFVALLRRSRELEEKDHPKVMETIRAARSQLERTPSSKVLVFTQYRDTASHLVKRLGAMPELRVARFVGQASKEEDAGLSQKEQVRILSQYRDGDLNTLVATCIAEEGLDIPDVDLVVFYEPIPSGIRYIQRKGRTGRRQVGKAIVLLAENTLDVAYHAASTRRVTKMRKIVQRLNKQLAPVLRLGNKPKPTPELFKPSSQGEEEEKKIEEEGMELDTRGKDSTRMLTKEFLNRRKMKGIGSVEKWVWTQIMKKGQEGVEIDDLVDKAAEKGWEPSVVKMAVSNLTSSGNLMKPSPEKAVSPTSMAARSRTATERGPGVHEILVEKVYPGRAVVWVDDKWRARMEVWNFEGPESLVKKSARFLARAELYHEGTSGNDRILCVRVDEIVQVL